MTESKRCFLIRACLGALLGAVCGFSFGSIRSSAEEAAGAASWRAIRIADLPAPPSELQACLTRSDVTLIHGGERPSLVDPTRSTGARRGEFDAETRYRLSYTYKSRCQWHWADYAEGKRLHFTVRYERLKLNASHQVWLQELPEVETFWDSPLLRHELDHVQLSSDRRLSSLFIKAVNTHRRIELTREESVPLIALATRRMTASGGGRSVLSFLRGDDAAPFLEKILQAEFGRTIQLIEIRYQELDRQTEHGKLAIPKEGTLAEWLQQ